MEKLSVSLDRTFLILEKYSLTVEEWFVTQLLFLSSADERHRTEYIDKYTRLPRTQRRSILDILKTLQQKGVILQSYRLPNLGETFDPEEVPLNKDFLKAWMKISGDMGDELYNSYPEEIGGLKMRNFSKFYHSYEELYYAYGKAIGWNPTKHAQVMDILEWAKENQRLAYGLCEFIISHKWNELEGERRDGIKGERCIIEEA